MLVFGQNHYHKNFRMCASSRVNRECQYSHEPLVEPLEDQAEATQADLFDSLVEAESEEYRQLLSGGAVSAASAGVANSGGTAHPTAPADGPADQAQIASERQANESIGYYESAKPMGQTEEAMPQAELPHSTGPPYGVTYLKKLVETPLATQKRSDRPLEDPGGPCRAWIESDVKGGLYKLFQVSDPILLTLALLVLPAP